MASTSSNLVLAIGVIAALVSGVEMTNPESKLERFVRFMQVRNRQSAYPGSFPGPSNQQVHNYGEHSDHWATTTRPSDSAVGAGERGSTSSSQPVARRCYYCYGTPDVCERSNIQYYCNENERFCKLDVNTIAYPYVKQQCHSSCVENVKSDGTGYTYCTRVDLGNCYRQQCNRISGGTRVGASTSTTVLLATTLALAGAASTLL